MRKNRVEGDFIRENENEYVTNLIQNEKKNLYVKIGMGTLYMVLLIVSLFVI